MYKKSEYYVRIYTIWIPCKYTIRIWGMWAMFKTCWCVSASSCLIGCLDSNLNHPKSNIQQWQWSMIKDKAIKPWSIVHCYKTLYTTKWQRQKYKNNDKFKGMMWSCTWVLETHVTSMTISEVVSVAVLSNLPQTTSNVTIVKPRTNCSCIHTCVYSYTHVLVKCIDPTYFY